MQQFPLQHARLAPSWAQRWVQRSCSVQRLQGMKVEDESQGTGGKGRRCGEEGLAARWELLLVRKEAGKK